MHDHDEGRTADSDRRRARDGGGRAASARRHHAGRGGRDPARSLELRFINDSTVANLRVLNAVVVDPAARTIWHSTTMQPLAPFGEMVPLTVDGSSAGGRVAAGRSAPRGRRASARGRGGGGDAASLAALRGRAGRRRRSHLGSLGGRRDDRSRAAAPRVGARAGALVDRQARGGRRAARRRPTSTRRRSRCGPTRMVARAMIADRQGRRAEALAALSRRRGVPGRASATTTPPFSSGRCGRGSLPASRRHARRVACRPCRICSAFRSETRSLRASS